MKAVSYQREKQFFEGVIENHVGIFDELESSKYNYVKIYHPIIDGVLMRGICHTNATNVVGIIINTVVIDAAIGKPII